jgi:hypothetical protein
MILVDANLLLYAYGSRSPHHAAARRWVEEAFSGAEPVGIPWMTALAFLRISTNPRMSGSVLSIAEAVSIVREWFARPNVVVVHPSDRHWEVLERLLIDGQVRGPLVSDAHVAALAIEHGATLFSSDRDFTRFGGLDLVNPLNADG